MIKTTVNAIMDNVIVNYDELSTTEMEDRITYYISLLINFIDTPEEVKENIPKSKNIKDIMDNIEQYIPLVLYDQVEEKISVHINMLLDDLRVEKVSTGVEENLRQITMDNIMGDIGKCIAGSTFYKVRDQIDYFIGCLYLDLRIEGIIPRVDIEDELSSISSKLEEMEIKVNPYTYCQKNLDLPLEGKRIGPNETDPEEEADDELSMEDSCSEAELDQQLNAYFREGGMKMYTGYYPSPPKKRSRNHSSEEENTSCCRIKVS